MDDEAFAALAGIAALSAKYRGPASSVATALGGPSVAQILRALDQFMECVRYLNTRRTKETVLSLSSEAAVQDALFLMLKPWVVDLVPENPTNRAASRFAVKDFVSASLRMVIEAKYVRDQAHGRSLSKELHDDIEMYRTHPACTDLIFFVYDPDALIPDRGALERHITVERVYGGVPLTCHLIVKP